MIASGAGAPSAPGSNTKKGLNRELNRARIGHLDRRVERRAVRTGTNTVVVHPGNTSITCSKCGHKDRESRKGPVFECTKCGYQTDADWNAAINIKGRGHNIFSAWKATRERGRGGTLVQAGSRRGSRTGTAGEGGAWRSAPSQPQRLPLASKHHRRRPRRRPDCQPMDISPNGPSPSPPSRATGARPDTSRVAPGAGPRTRGRAPRLPPISRSPGRIVSERPCDFRSASSVRLGSARRRANAERRVRG